MPRGFLVKRYSSQLSNDSSSPTSQSLQHSSCVTLPLTSRPLIYRYSDEDPSDSSSSEQEATSVTSIPSPLSINQSSHPLVSLALSPPLLSYSQKYTQAELPQELPLALTKSSLASDCKTPTANYKCGETPSALDLRCPSFIFHFPDRIPSSAPPIYQRSISSLVSSPPNNSQSLSLTTSKKRHSIDTQQKSVKKHKVVRKLNFDEHKSSPVSGTFIRDSDSEDDFTTTSSCVRRSGDIDPSLNVVVITEEARAEIAKIENKIGDYICALCKERFNDAFGLAQHRCTRIVHVEYRCPECDKVFNCPANLASHRRWHKPRNNTNTHNNDNKKSKVSVVGTAALHSELNNTSNCSVETNSNVLGETTAVNQEGIDGHYECECCCKKFRRSAYLKKHLLSLHNIDIESNKQKENEAKNFTLNSNSIQSKAKVFDFTNSLINTSINDKELVRNEFKHKCLACSAVFHNEISLELHNKSVHTNESLGCKYCQNIFITKTELTIHINKYHSSKDNESILKSVRPVIKLESIE